MVRVKLLSRRNVAGYSGEKKKGPRGKIERDAVYCEPRGVTRGRGEADCSRNFHRTVLLAKAVGRIRSRERKKERKEGRKTETETGWAVDWDIESRAPDTRSVPFNSLALNRDRDIFTSNG